MMIAGWDRPCDHRRSEGTELRSITMDGFAPGERSREPRSGLQALVYSPPMASTAITRRGGIFRWTRVRFTLVVSVLLGLLLSISNESPTLTVIARAVIVGMGALFAFGLLEQWPQRLPRKLPRSVLQLIGI